MPGPAPTGDLPESTPRAAPAASFDVYEPDNTTFVKTLDAVVSASGNMPLNGQSELTTLTIPATSAADRQALTRGRVVRVKLHGAVRSNFAVGPRTQDTIAPGGATGELLTASGVSLLQYEWSKVLIDTLFASGGPLSSTTQWDWSHPAYDASSWSDPSGAPQGTWAPPPQESPLGWPDPFSGRYTFTNKGLFRIDINIASAGFLWIGVTAATQFVANFDGQTLLTGPAAPQSAQSDTYRMVVKVDAGTHCLAVYAENPAGGGWMSADVYALGPTYEGAELNTSTFLLHTGYIPSTTTHYPWKWQNNVTQVPGMAPGRIVRWELARCQARSQLVGWTCAFTDTTDSNGQPWVDLGPFTLPTYSTMWDLLQKQAEAGRMDVWANPSSKTLYAYNYGTRGSFHTNPVSPPTWAGWDATNPDGRLYSLTHREVSQSSDGGP